MLSLFEDERVDPIPILCDQRFYGLESDKPELFLEIVYRRKMDCSAFLDTFARWFAKARVDDIYANLHAQLGGGR